MQWLDWIVVCLPLSIVLFIGLRTQKYVRGVSDFLSAGRVAGRYVVAVANGEAGMGLISLVAMFEMYYSSGFAFSFWSSINIPISIFLALSGYCIYRFRETRAMTLGQFFEMRYSKSFRIFAGILQSISGVINYAIFPAVGGRFLVYYLDLPVTTNIFGLAFPTFGLIMMLFLSIAVIIIMFGGQITIMVTDCVQGIISYPLYLIVVIFIIYRFSWFQEMAPTLLDRPVGKSMLNPYDIENLRVFNLFYIFVGIIGGVLNRMAWSGTQGYNSAAANAHEQKMGGVLGTWRSGFSIMMYILLAIAAYTFLNNADYTKGSQTVRKELAKKALGDVAGEEKFAQLRGEVNNYLKSGKVDHELKTKIVKIAGEEGFKSLTMAENEKPFNNDSIKGVVQTALKSEDKGKAQVFGTIYGQMLVPLSIRQFLPIGITGIFCAIAIFLLISTDTTYMHSWGSIIVQDVILPFRKKPFTPKQQLLLLRCVIACVAVFAFFFSLLFGQVDYIMMFFAITGAIWLGGAGPCIVFGLYWKRGTQWGAWASLLSGSILAVGGILAQNYWVTGIYPWLVKMQMVDSVRTVLETVSSPFNPYIIWTVTPDKFPINSQEIYFITIIISLTLYISLSLLTGKQPFNMDRMLHRGKYHREGKKSEQAAWSFRTFVPRLMGIDSQYTKGDKVLAWSVFIWSFGYGFGCFLTIVIWNTIYKWPNHWWANWFLINNLIVAGIIGVVSTVWFTIGGTRDLVRMFKRLDEKEDNLLDDGRVVGHVSADDVAMVENIDHVIISDDSEEDKQK